MDNPETLATVGKQYTRLKQAKPNGQSRMVNTETQTTLDIQDT